MSAEVLAEAATEADGVAADVDAAGSDAPAGLAEAAGLCVAALDDDEGSADAEVAAPVVACGGVT